jgi:6-phosphogluconolactonase
MHKKLSRRNFCLSAGAGLASLSGSRAGAANDLLLYVGTYTGGKSKSEGIYVYRMNAETGKLTLASTAKGVASPSFLTIDPAKKYLYAANEVGQFNGQKGGGVTSFSIDRKSGALVKLNDQTSPGVPCYVSVDQAGKYLFAANYGGGNVVMYPIKPDGSLLPQCSMIQHSGKGGDPKRQDGPHAHCIVPGPDGQYVYSADLGLDKVLIYKIDAEQSKMIPHGEVAVKPAAGPRHLAFHPNQKFAYVINELDSTVTLLDYDKAKGALSAQQAISTLPADFKTPSYCADIHIHPGGGFLYGSNRGHDSIVIFSIDQSTGKLTLVGHELTGGKWPRNFGIDPGGKFLLAANQNTDNVVTFRIDAKTGKLTPTGENTAIPSPVCLTFLPAL